MGFLMSKTTKQTKTKNSTPSETPYLSVDERSAKGRALRDVAPRSSHAGWIPAKNRRDPVDLLIESNAGRLENLVPIRFGRMSESPFAFYRGSAVLMAADLANTPTSGLRVQACGDAHLMNFGGFATPERNIIFDINDLDETLPAPFEWDLKRLATSVIIAAKHLDFPMSNAARLVTDLVQEYRERMTDYAGMHALDVWYDKIDLQKYSDRMGDPEIIKELKNRLKLRIVKEQRRTAPDFLYPKLVTHQGSRPMIKDEPPLIFHPTAEQAPGLLDGYSKAIKEYRESLPDHMRTLFDRFHYFDLAEKVVGVGSVGTRCAVMLLMAADNDSLFLQIKEARTSVLEPYAGKSLYKNNGQRVIVGQRLMQAATDVFLGWTSGISGHHFYVRQLRDIKMSAIIDDWDPAMMRQYGRMCAHALARAHARTGDAAMISGYMGTSRSFDDAIGEFAVEYAAQNQADYRTFIKAIREGKINAVIES